MAKDDERVVMLKSTTWKQGHRFLAEKRKKNKKHQKTEEKIEEKKQKKRNKKTKKIMMTTANLDYNYGINTKNSTHTNPKEICWYVDNDGGEE